MGFVALGLLLFVLHFLGIGPPGRWTIEPFGDLWKFLVPFGLALLWWLISDKFGITQRREMRKMDKRQADRRERQLEDLGLGTKKRQPPKR